jgi:hypothetical protein
MAFSLKNLFNKRQEHVAQSNAISDQLMDFYSKNSNMFEQSLSADMSQKDKKALIKSVYDQIGYTGLPSGASQSDSSDIHVYRGISANSEADINKFTNEFVNGEVFFGKNASIYGTGIYMCSNKDTPIQYATSFDNEYGAVIHGSMSSSCRIVDINELQEMKDMALSSIRQMHTDDGVQRYCDLLEDNGLFAAVAGYDAINIPEKEYVVVLNRGQLEVNDIDIFPTREKQNTQHEMNRNANQSQLQDIGDKQLNELFESQAKDCNSDIKVNELFVGNNIENIELDQLFQDANHGDQELACSENINLDGLFSGEEQSLGFSEQAPALNDFECLNMDLGDR